MYLSRTVIVVEMISMLRLVWAHVNGWGGAHTLAPTAQKTSVLSRDVEGQSIIQFSAGTTCILCCLVHTL